MPFSAPSPGVGSWTKTALERSACLPFRIASKVFRYELGGMTPGHNVDKVGFFLPILRLVVPITGKGEAAHRDIIAGPAQLRITGQAAHQGNMVQHVDFPPFFDVFLFLILLVAQHLLHQNTRWGGNPTCSSVLLSKSSAALELYLAVYQLVHIFCVRLCGQEKISWLQGLKIEKALSQKQDHSATAGGSWIDNSHVSLSNLHKCQDYALYFEQKRCTM